ncbi:S1C family serine protease [Rhodococcus artemisiae]|uniref:Trypsin-like peptidase domain-containing protein n=1 Tax=Rhodococcus artemisiae TaxID=714159 RepID=A0ABU7LJC2_9NOCA|nr:trypsin-like peptidase domain-containing protein [Rhodococcus artemisiae]MEE2061650.1 trypsin-like peptidase domain-containing protein [Rhodococcus artemisiae]
MTGRSGSTLLVALAATASLLVSAPAVVEVGTPPPAPVAAPAPPPPSPLSFEELATRTESVVVNIDARRGWSGVAGTGIVLTPDGVTLTNHHVVSGATEITAVSPATGLIYDVAVTGYDPTRDIAVLQLGAAHDLPVATLADTPPEVGSLVTAFGNADGGGVVVAAPGTVVAHDRNVVVRDSTDGSRHRLTGMLQTDAAIRPGDSGGPLVDAFGVVVGVNTAGSVYRDQTETIGIDTSNESPEAYAVPIGEALDVLEQVRSGVGSDTVHVGPTPHLGVSVTTARSDGGDRGAEVLWVSYGSPAYRSGLEPGFVIVAFDGVPVSSTNDLEEALRRHRPGDRVRVEWIDEAGVTGSTDLTLESGPVR